MARVTAAFEVEHTTSIYSGIVRMLDPRWCADHAGVKLFPVAPDAGGGCASNWHGPFRRVADLSVRFLPYGELRRGTAGRWPGVRYGAQGGRDPSRVLV